VRNNELISIKEINDYILGYDNELLNESIYKSFNSKIDNESDLIMNDSDLVFKMLKLSIRADLQKFSKLMKYLYDNKHNNDVYENFIFNDIDDSFELNNTKKQLFYGSNNPISINNGGNIIVLSINTKTLLIEVHYDIDNDYVITKFHVELNLRDGSDFRDLYYNRAFRLICDFKAAYNVLVDEYVKVFNIGNYYV
jgi:hypothetical protein